MNGSKVKLLLLISLLTVLAAVISSVAAGSHFEIGYNDNAFHFDFKVATGRSHAASVLGLIALVTGLAGVGLHLSGSGRSGEADATEPGPAVSPRSPDLPGVLRRLAKSRSDTWLGGVCGGLGENTPLPSWVWRLAFLILLCWYGTGFLLYFLLWICLPEPRQEATQPATAAYAAK
jgi:phage shock protein C